MNPQTRVCGALTAVILAMPCPGAAQSLLDATSHPKFVNPMPIAARVDATGGQHFEMEMSETTQWLGLVTPANQPLMTKVWGYGVVGSGVSYPGPTFVTARDQRITVTWNNHLPGTHLLPVDMKVHLAHPTGGIPAVTHLHGGHTESASDGLPEAWFTQGFAQTGPHFVKPNYVYDNDQEAATLWYHDHALGITRLNVYAGLAGFYLLRDSNENSLIGSGVLPAGPYEIETVVQDRMFDQTGALYYPSDDPDLAAGFPPLPVGPSVLPEFFGDFVLVNGGAWPYLSVEPRKYRIRLLNGSDSRFYVFELHEETAATPQTFLQIGTDDGLLPKALDLQRLLLAPGERADLVLDFSSFAAGTQLMLKNFGPDSPFKGFNADGTLSDGAGGVEPAADPATTGQILKFVVDLPMDGSVPDATVMKSTKLRSSIKKLKQTGATRQLVLFEGLDSYGRLQPMLGTLDQGSRAWFEPITETPTVNDVELWEIYNATEDAHPIHLHLVAFQLLERQPFLGSVAPKSQPQHDGSLGVGGTLTVDRLLPGKMMPAKNEEGWKDTAVMLPGQVTRVIAKFDREGRYVWHCHILSHEDHEMMRPYEVLPAAQQQRRLAAIAPEDVPLRLEARGPELSFSVGTPTDVEIRVFNVLGQRVRAFEGRTYAPGDHRVTWDGRDDAGRWVRSGVYFYRVRTPLGEQTARGVLVR